MPNNLLSIKCVTNAYLFGLRFVYTFIYAMIVVSIDKYVFEVNKILINGAARAMDKPALIL